MWPQVDDCREHHYHHFNQYDDCYKKPTWGRGLALIGAEMVRSCRQTSEVFTSGRTLVITIRMSIRAGMRWGCRWGGWGGGNKILRVGQSLPPSWSPVHLWRKQDEERRRPLFPRVDQVSRLQRDCFSSAFWQQGGGGCDCWDDDPNLPWLFAPTDKQIPPLSLSRLGSRTPVNC